MTQLPHLARRVACFLGRALLVWAVLLAGAARSEPWSFGVMADTQWWDASNDPDQNPNSVAGEIIRQVNPRFIAAGVKFVIQVGDLSDSGGEAGIDSRAVLAQPLYDAGIGFFPLRGNHDASQAVALEFQKVFPQTQGGGSHVFGAGPFNSPLPSLAGLSYCFDFGNARFVLLDQFVRADGSLTTLTNADLTLYDGILDQLPWINDQLSRNRSAGSHAFVFAHRNLINQMHIDSLMGINPAANPDAQNAFISSLQTNGVRYCMSGHDHVHHRALIASPDGRAAIEEIIAASDSSKFYVPNGSPLDAGTIPNDAAYNSPPRETPVAQECYSIGYYIFTIDGPRVTVDYYSAAIDPVFSGETAVLSAIPVLDFRKKESFGYSLNGSEFIVPQGGSYTNVHDGIKAGAGFVGTAMKIVAGANQSTNTDAAGRKLTKTVDTGWSCPAHGEASDVLSLWGLADLGAGHADAFVLSMSFNPAALTPDRMTNGFFCLATRTGSGPWTRAVDAVTGGTTKFALGPWQPGYGLGTYGIDPAAGAAWAVVNQTGDFAVTEVLPGLTIRQNGSEITLSWPESPGWKLQSCRDLRAADWTTVVSDSPTNFVVSADAQSQFFRLIRP